MKLIDTHTHLYSSEFEQDRDEMIERAISAGVTHFCLPAIDSSCTASMYSLESQYPDHISVMMGLHPTYVTKSYMTELEHVKEQLKIRKFCAIGEIGIDLYWDKTLLTEQKIVFKEQIRLAKRYDLPIVIHCREAFDEVFEVLAQENHQSLRGVFHCFTGTYQQALRAISFNMKLGVGGVATFKNGKIDVFLSKIDLKHIVLETDAPYLAPLPYRGKRNESSYLTLVAEKLALIYDVTIPEIAQKTTENAKHIFGL